MESHAQLMQKAFELRKNQQIPEALAIYEPMWKEDTEIFSDWDGWSYGVCLAKNGRHQEALDLCRILYARDKNRLLINSLYARCIYYTQFVKVPPPPVQVLRKATKAMIQLSPPHQDYSLTIRAIFRLVKALMNGPVIDWKEIQNWLQQLDPDLLNDQPYQQGGVGGKMTDFASPLEEWYSAMIKVKAGLTEPEALLELVTAARNRQLKWHYNNDIWFARKEAFACIQLGRRAEGEKILREIIRQKQDWFLVADLADVVVDPAEALRLRSQAAMMHVGDLALKIRLFQNIQSTISKMEEYESESSALLTLILSIRQEKDWDIPPALRFSLAERKIDFTPFRQPAQLFGQLLPFFREMMYRNRKTWTGQIAVVRDKNRTGTITGEDGRNYFFRFHEALMPLKQIREGRRVRFESEPAYDKKRKVMSVAAVRLTPWKERE